MYKDTIAILSLAAIVLAVIAYVGYGPAVATQLSGCRSSLYGPPAACALYPDSAGTLGIALYLGGALAALAAWILGLVRTAHIKHWGWFVAVLLTPPLGTLLYGLVGPTTTAAL